MVRSGGAVDQSSPDDALASAAAEAADLRRQLQHTTQAITTRELVARRMRAKAAACADELRATSSERDVLRHEVVRLSHDVDEVRGAYEATSEELAATQARLGYRLMNRFALAMRRSPLIWRVTRGSVRLLTRR